MNDLQSNFISAIAEISVLKETKEIIASNELLGLSTGLLPDKYNLIFDTLQYMKENEGIINNIILINDKYKITLSDKYQIPKPSETEKDIIKDKLIKRIILFKLYQIFRELNHRFTNYPLVELAEVIGIDKTDIQRNVHYLQNECYLEYNVADGGNCTSDITNIGIKLCEDRYPLFEEFGSIRIREVEENNIKSKESGKNIDQKKVWVVHGRNIKARNAMFEFLRSIGLEPIEWSEAISLTGEASPYIGQILENAFDNAQAVVVIFTGDDVAKLKDEFIVKNDNHYERELTPQSRPNVIFEAGMAFGFKAKRTILVELGETRPISDLTGRHVIKLNNDATNRNNLISRLKTAGCDIKDITHKTDWLKAGDFESCI